MSQPKGQKEAMAASQQATGISKQQWAMQQQMMDKIMPLANAMMSLGISPQQFMASPLGQSMLGMMRGGISEEFAGARQNLLESLGGAGLTGSGVGVGPMANLFGQEALAQANLWQQLPQMGLNLGLQGAGLLTGQQQMLQPGQWMGMGIQGFNELQQRNLLGTILGAAGTALGGPLGGAILGGKKDQVIFG